MNDLARRYKSQFPFFQTHPEVVYLDSAATTQLPQSVIDIVHESMIHGRGNPGRGAYPLAQRNITMIESVRSKVASFLRTSPDTIHFTHGATDGFNRLAQGCLHTFPDGAEILYAADDHTSFVAPWEQLQASLQKLGREVRLVSYNRHATGGIDVDNLASKLSQKTAIVLLTHIHNIYGTEAEIDTIVEVCRKQAPQSLVVCDATQSIGHIPVHVEKLGVDALCFSGHKICALSGIGVTYLSSRANRFIESLYTGSIASPSDSRREFGSPSTTAIASLGAAIDFLDTVGMSAIDAHMNELTAYALHKLRTLQDVTFSYGPHHWSCSGGHGILSFSIEGIPSSEIGLWLAQNNIYVRTGDHCVHRKAETDWVRMSAFIYNDSNDVDTLVESLRAYTE